MGVFEGWNTYLEALANVNGDEMMAKCTALYEPIEKEGRLVQNADIPGYEDVKEYMNCIHNADPTPAGDCVAYTSACDTKGGQIMEKGLFDKYRSFSICQMFLRWIELEALSQKQDRLVKLVNVIDLFKISMNSGHKDFKAEDEKFRQPFGIMMPYNMVNRYMINMSWILVKMATSFMPKD